MAVLLAGSISSLAANPQDLVPAAVKAKGGFSVVTDPSFGPPWSFHPNDDTSQYDGIDVGIAKGVADKLGLKVEFVSLSFDGIIPALKAGRYDLAMAGMGDTGRADATVDGYAVSAYLQEHGMLKDTGVEPLTCLPLSPAPLGIGASKDQAGFRDAVDAALNEMIADRTYAKILAKWGISDLAVKEAKVNQFSQ